MTTDVLGLLCFSELLKKKKKLLQRISVSLRERGTKGSSKTDSQTDTHTHTQIHTVLENNYKEKSPSYI